MKRKIRKGICLTIVGVFLAACALISQSTFASGEKSSLTIYYHGVTPKGNQVVFSGAEFSLYQAAKKTGNQWKLCGEFEKAPVHLYDLSSSGQKKAAEQLYKFALGEKIRGTRKTTGSDGKAVFSDLEEGMYLCSSVRDISYENYVFRSSPFLVFVPQTDENGNSLHEITVEPKNEWVEPGTPSPTPVVPEKHPSSPNESPSTPDTSLSYPEERPESSDKDTVKTGDDTKIWPYVVLLTVSVSVFIFGVYKNRKKNWNRPSPL